MFDLFLFLKPQKQLFVITAEKNTKVSGIKLNTDSTFQGFQFTGCSPIYTRRQVKSEIPQGRRDILSQNIPA